MKGRCWLPDYRGTASHSLTDTDNKLKYTCSRDLLEKFRNFNMIFLSYRLLSYLFCSFWICGLTVGRINSINEFSLIRTLFNWSKPKWSVSDTHLTVPQNVNFHQSVIWGPQWNHYHSRSTKWITNVILFNWCMLISREDAIKNFHPASELSVVLFNEIFVRLGS